MPGSQLQRTRPARGAVYMRGEQATNAGGKTLVRLNQVSPEKIEEWKHHNHFILRARLRRAESRGQVRVLSPVTMTPWGQGEVLVERIKKSSSDARWYFASALLAASLLFVIALWVWVMRYEILGFFASLILCAMLFLVTRANHSGGCVGIHCDGCKG